MKAIAMAALLLLCARYGRVNDKVSSEDGVARGGKRAAPPRKWLQDLAASQGLERLYRDSLVDCASRPPDLSAGHAHCVALVKVVPGSAADGALTPLFRQEEYLRDFLLSGALCNFYTLKVVKVHRAFPASGLHWPHTITQRSLVASQLCGAQRT